MGKLSHTPSQAAWQRAVLLIVLAYEALGCVTGGIFLEAAPDGRLMNMPITLMHGAFPDFLIPGIILLGLGLVNAIAFFSVLRRSVWDWVMALFAMGGLGIWFTVEIAILQELHWLHFMWGVPVIIGGFMAIPLLPIGEEAIRKFFLVGGIVSSIWYIAMNIIVPANWPAYTIASQTVSELSAVGAPTRILWVLLSIPYTLLSIGFGWGVWKSGSTNHRLRIVGGLLLAYSVLGIAWPFAPMHLRETLAAGGGTFTDTAHISLGAITEVLFLLALIFAEFAFGKTFRMYSVVTLLTLILFGALTFSEAPGIAENQPTPFIGIWERVNIGVFLLWVIILSVELLHEPASRPSALKKKSRISNARSGTAIPA